MKLIQFISFLVLFLFMLNTSCENEELSVDIQQEYFYFHDIETGATYSVTDINALISEPWNELDFINNENPEAEFIPLLIQGNVEIMEVTYCLEFVVLLDPTELIRTYTNNEAFGGFTCGLPNGTSENNSLIFFINSLELITIGQIEEYIDLEFSTIITVIGEETEYIEMLAELHVLRDQ